MVDSVIPHLYYFKPYEFGDWLDHMDPRLLVLLDVFRHRWDKSLVIMMNGRIDGRLGRHKGEDHDSQHNIDRWGEVRAADCFVSGLNTRADSARAFLLAKEIGFTGIGIYPDWMPSPGMHFDTRRDRRPGDPAHWGAVRDRPRAPQRYVSWDYAASKLPEVA